MIKYISLYVGGETEYIAISEIMHVHRASATSTEISRTSTPGVITITHTSDEDTSMTVATAIMDTVLALLQEKWYVVTKPVVIPKGVTIESIAV
jgi:hypothetical protein